MTPLFIQLQDDLLAHARTIREGGSEVKPVAFFVTGYGVEVMPLDVDKPMWRKAILLGILKYRAAAVILHTEAWAVLGKDVPAALAAKEAGLASLQEFAGRTEILRSSMETIEGFSRDLHVEISPEGKLGPTVVFGAGDGARREGLLVGFYEALAVLATSGEDN